MNGIEAGATADQTGAQILALFSNSITAGHIAAGAIGASEIGNDVVNSQHYAAGSIDNEHIADNAINSEHYAAGSIDNEHMAANSINSDQYVDGSIDRVHLAADIIDGTKIANDVINSEHYVAGSIDNEHISGMAASKLSGALPAIDGSALTGLPASGANTSLSNLSATGENRVCQAWGNVNQVGTQALTDSNNISSISDIGTGQTRFTFANAMANVDYACVASTRPEATEAEHVNFNQHATGSVVISNVYRMYGASAVFVDSQQLSMITFGD